MPFKTNSLSARVAEELTEMIARRRFQPGEKLPNELELAEELHVSRTTLREALRILSTRGLVEVRRGIGTFVTRSQSIHDDYDVLKIQNTNVNLKDLYEMRLIIEPQAAYYACIRASDEELNTIFRYGELDEQMILKRDPQWDETEQKFHNSIASATHNQFITALLPVFNRAIHHGIILANQAPQVAELTLHDHRILMQYLKERNAEAAKTAMVLHMMNTMRAFAIERD
ncbi:MAG: FadR family transcriptional regulator [Oscillospiraceae bacterium]|nr:FadR family transcriptional regulator [Oscillospiraceae bacterium]